MILIEELRKVTNSQQKIILDINIYVILSYLLYIHICIYMYVCIRIHIHTRTYKILQNQYTENQCDF